MQLAPTSAQLVIGGIGSGKSTELLLATKRLSEAEDTLAAYVDVSKWHDLSVDLDGVLLVLAGLKLVRRLKDVDSTDVSSAKEDFRKWAHGYTEHINLHEYYQDQEPPDGFEYEPTVFRKGVLKPPRIRLGWPANKRLAALKVLMGALPHPFRHFVVLFDSLDRLSDVERFRTEVLEDIRALRSAGVGVVVAGPNRLLYGVNRPVVDLFDHLHMQPALDIGGDPRASVFLGSIIARRTDESIVPEEARESLARWSGGVLRDLIGLTGSVLEEAFIADAEQVDSEHIARAADTFGRSMMFGLNSEDLAKLLRVHNGGTFIPTSDEDLALLESRRVIAYQGPPARFAVHPTIAPLLEALRNQ